MLIHKLTKIGLGMVIGALMLGVLSACSQAPLMCLTTHR